MANYGRVAQTRSYIKRAAATIRTGPPTTGGSGARPAAGQLWPRGNRGK